MTPTFGLIITIAIAGLSVALALGAVADAIKTVASAIRSHDMTIQTMSDTHRYRMDALTETIERK